MGAQQLAGVLSIVAMLVVPLPPALLDVLLSCDVMGAAAVLVVALSVEDPLDLSAFPALLLVATLFRLGFSQAAATRRLCDRVAWEFDPPSRHSGGHHRPASLSDAAIAKVVAETYARKPGGW